MKIQTVQILVKEDFDLSFRCFVMWHSFFGSVPNPDLWGYTHDVPSKSRKPLTHRQNPTSQKIGILSGNALLTPKVEKLKVHPWKGTEALYKPYGPLGE